jgi:hypothetical protein
MVSTDTLCEEVMNLWVPLKTENFLNWGLAIRFSRTTLLHGFRYHSNLKKVGVD